MNIVEIRKYLDKIIESDCFSRSDIYKKLLKYLTEATIEGKRPKEFTIGLDVFNHKADDPATSNVRVYVHKLRKKLDTYYNKEGIHDPIRFSIPKGSYSIEFKNKKDVSYQTRVKYLWISLAAAILLFIIHLLFFVNPKSDNEKLKKTAFWHEFFDNGKETVIVAGDFFMFTDLKIEDERGLNWNIRDTRVNSEEQFMEIINNDSLLHPEDFRILSDVTYMPRDALFSMQYIIPVLHDNNVPYQIVLSSNFKWDIFNNYNIIYIGAFKNLKTLSILTEKLGISFNNSSGEISVKGPEGVNNYSSYFFINDNKNIDYTLVSKMPGSDNNIIYLFVSNNDIGCIESVKYFTQLDSVKSFDDRILNDAHYFKAIYKAEGIIRTGVTFDLKEYEHIADSSLQNFWHY